MAGDAPGAAAEEVAVVGRCTGAACWGRKDFFIHFSLNFGCFFAARLSVAFRLIPPSGGRFWRRHFHRVSSFNINTSSLNIVKSFS